jgi:fructose-1,6-bisphosphatase/inositol monophosphatase family enzyme
MASGALLVAEAGGRVTADSGSPLGFEQRTILASNGRLHRLLVERLGRKGVTGAGRGSRAVHLVH